jgi:hypothetical protein
MALDRYYLYPQEGIALLRDSYDAQLVAYIRIDLGWSLGWS